jgi:hypothetical protein
MIARDTVVAERIAADVRAQGQRAFVIAGEHEYGVQLDGQLRLAGLPRAGAADRASLLRALRAAGPFDEHGDPVDAPVWLWRADASWVLQAERPL